MIIDFHVHCFSDDIVDKAMVALTNASNIEPLLDGRVSTAIKAAKKNNIDYIVILPIATKASQTHRLNDWASQIAGCANDRDNIDAGDVGYAGDVGCSDDSGDGGDTGCSDDSGDGGDVGCSDDSGDGGDTDSNIISFGTVHPANEDWESELDRIKALGLKGIKLHPDYQNFFVDDSRMIPFYRKAAKLDLPIIFHCGKDIGLPPPYHCTPDRLANVLDIVPEATFIASHMGGFDYEYDVEKHLIGRNLYLDTAYSIECLSHERIKSMILAHGAEKILFGTDSPWKGQKSGINIIKALGLTKFQEDLILGKNAAKLLGINPDYESSA